MHTERRHRATELTRRRGVAAVVGLMMLLGLAVAPAVVAAPESETPPEQPPVMVVLDASGSMLEADAGGSGTRMDAAIEATTDLIAATPEDARMGVMVYGSTVGNTEAEKEAGCQDIVTLGDVGPVDKEGLTVKVSQVSASGWTPIGAALEEAAGALPDEEGRSIVLVSDGVDTCAPPDPCEVAADLTEEGVALTVHTVGFRVDARAREQLECIAEATGGTYADAADAGELSEELSVQAQRAMRSYVPAGQQVQGGSDAASALDIFEGDYVIELGSTDGASKDSASQFFAVPMREGDVLHVAASLIRPQEDGGSSTDHTTIQVEQVGQEACRSDSDSNRASNLLGGPPTAVLITDPATENGECFPDGYTVFRVERSGEVAANATLPVELSVHVQAPVDPATVQTAPPVDMPTPELTDSSRTSAQAVTPGLNYSTASPIDPGTYRSEIVSGEFHVFRVHLDLGERIAVAVSPESGTGDSTSLQLNMAAPDRSPLPLAESSIGFRSGHFDAGIEDGEVLADAMARSVDPASSEPPNQAGDYYVMVSLDGDDKRAVPYTLQLEVGSPPTPVTAPEPIADPKPLTAAAIAAEAEQDTSDDGADATAGPSAAGDAADTNNPSEDAKNEDTASEAALDQGATTDDGGGSPLVWILAAGGLVLVALGGWLVATRTRT